MHEHLSKKFRAVQETDWETAPTIDQFLKAIDGSSHSHMLLTFFLAAPFITPSPLPGLSIPFGFIILVAGIRISLGKGFWLPSWLRNRTISSQSARKICEIAAWILEELEKVIRPRLTSICNFPFLHGILIACGGALLALPLPPGTNAPPAWFILLLSLGSLEKDGFLVLLGYLVFVGNLAFFSGLIFLGVKGFHAFF